MITSYSCHTRNDRFHALLMCDYDTDTGAKTSDRYPLLSISFRDNPGSPKGLWAAADYDEAYVNVRPPDFGNGNSEQADAWLSGYARIVDAHLDLGELPVPRQLKGVGA